MQVSFAMLSLPLRGTKWLPNGQLMTAECGGPGYRVPGYRRHVSLAVWQNPGIPKWQLSLGHQGMPVPQPNSIYAIYDRALKQSFTSKTPLHLLG